MLPNQMDPEVARQVLRASRNFNIGLFIFFGTICGIIGWFVVIPVVRLANTPQQAKTYPITRSELGEKWPFTVESAEVNCVAPYEVVIAVGEAPKKLYAMSGLAKTRGIYQDLKEIWALSDDEIELRRLGRKHPTQVWRKDISPVFDPAMKYCEAYFASR